MKLTRLIIGEYLSDYRIIKTEQNYPADEGCGCLLSPAACKEQHCCTFGRIPTEKVTGYATLLHYLHKFQYLEHVSAGFVAFFAGFQHRPLLRGRIVALFAGFPKQPNRPASARNRWLLTNNMNDYE